MYYSSLNCENISLGPSLVECWRMLTEEWIILESGWLLKTPKKDPVLYTPSLDFSRKSQQVQHCYHEQMIWRMVSLSPQWMTHRQPDQVATCTQNEHLPDWRWVNFWEIGEKEKKADDSHWEEKDNSLLWDEPSDLLHSSKTPKSATVNFTTKKPSATADVSKI